MLRKKRGQITVFIIVGLLILLTYFLLSYYGKESIEERELINPEFIPVQEYVETCTKTIAREAIDIIGVNGGYITFPERVKSNPNSYLQLSPIDAMKNPYWWYDGRFAIPPLDYLKKQISDYTKEHIPECINNFSSFYNKYTIINLGDFDVITEIGEEDVTVKTIYPIVIKDKFNKTLAELQNYIITIPIRLKKVHELASEIMEREKKDYFIEKKTIDLISMDDQKIPTTGIEISCGKKRWETQKVEDRLKSLLQVNLPYIKIQGTNFNPNSIITPYQLQDTNPYSEQDTYNESYYFYHYIWDITDIQYSNMHVSFGYDRKWPMLFYPRPSKGKYMEANPERGAEMLSLICLQIWHFTYDIVYPVKVTIVDDKTENNERYTFTYAFKAQINHLKPETSNFAVEAFDTRDTYLEEEYCADLDNEIEILAQDKISGAAISKANITFTCGRYHCDIGQTEPNWDNSGIPSLKKKFPYCSNGIVRASKDDYEETEMFIQTGRRLDTDPNENIGNSYTLEMTPVKFFNFTVVKHKLLNNGLTGAAQLEKNEKAMLTIKNADEKFQSYGAYPLEEPLKLLAKKDFTYDIEIFIMDNSTITGGYKNKWAVNWNYAPNPLDSPARLGNNITFHVIEKDFANEEDQYKFFAALQKNSQSTELLPRIK